MSELIEITTQDGTAEAYVARPGRAEDGTGPGVLVWMDAIGLRPQLEQMADRIASWGYVVLVPNAFYRDGTAAELAPQGDLRQPGERERFFEQAMPRVHGLTPDRVAADGAAYVDALLALDGVSGTRVAVDGYCMGAAAAIRTAAERPEQTVAVAGWHGARLATDDADSPHTLLPGLAGLPIELAFGFADQDAGMPAEMVDRFEGALADAGLTHSCAIFPGAAHGYAMADTSMYQEAGAERHFTELEALLGRTLLGRTEPAPTPA